MAIAFSCDGCGQRYQVAEALAGRRLKCKACGNPLEIPMPRPAKPAAAKPKLQTFGAPAPTQSRPMPQAPAARRPAPVGDYGLDDVLEAEPVTDDPYGLEDLPPVAEPVEDQDSSDELPGPRFTRTRPVEQKKRKKKRGGKEEPSKLVSGLKLALLIGCGLLILLSLFSKTILLVTLVIAGLAGVVLYVAGGLWCIVVPFRESAVCGIMNIFVPFYGLYYLLTRWEDMRKPFCTSLGGFVLLFGSAMLMPLAGVKMEDDQVNPNEMPNFGRQGGGNAPGAPPVVPGLGR